MALGDATSFVVMGSTSNSHGIKIVETRPLYVAATAITTDNGEWISTLGWTKATYVVDGITTGTVSFRGVNTTTAPANTVHGQAIYGVAASVGTPVATMTADGVISFDEFRLPMWIKAYISAGSSIALNLSLFVEKRTS